MRSLLLLILSAVFIASCNNADQSAATTSDSTQNNIAPAPQVITNETTAGCYSQIYERDTSSLQIRLANDSLSGQLVYKLFEKDRNDGMFQGHLNNDVLSGWYYFKSEGIMSVREVVWKVTNSQLWPAMGEMQIRNDTMVFSNPSALKFDSTHPFVKINCAE